MTMNVAPSVAAALERELESTMNEWLKQVNLLSIRTKVSLSDSDRAGHLPELYRDLSSACALAGTSVQPFPLQLPRTAKCAVHKVTSLPCSLGSRGCSKSPPSKHYISITGNVMQTNCF